MIIPTRLGPGRRASVEVPVHIHAFVEDAHHVDRLSTGANAVVERVRSRSVPPVAGANVVARLPEERVVGHKLNGMLNYAHVRFGLVVIPPLGGVVPDLLQIGLGGRGQHIAVHLP